MILHLQPTSKSPLFQALVERSLELDIRRPSEKGYSSTDQDNDQYGNQIVRHAFDAILRI